MKEKKLNKKETALLIIDMQYGGGAPRLVWNFSLLAEQKCGGG